MIRTDQERLTLVSTTAMARYSGRDLVRFVLGGSDRHRGCAGKEIDSDQYAASRNLWWPSCTCSVSHLGVKDVM